MRRRRSYLCSALVTWVLLLWCGNFVACNTRPQLIDYPVSGAFRRKQLQNQLRTSIAVVGTIGADVMVARPIPSHWDRNIPLELRKFNVRLENVLRGSIPIRSLEVYYFRVFATYDGPRQLGGWRTGERMLLFLRRDSGVYRMACDGIASSCAIPVTTGAHPVLSAKGNQAFELLLARLFLTKGQGITEQQFADDLLDNAYRYENVCLDEVRQPKPEYAVPQLKQLAAAGNDEAVQRSACKVLQSKFSIDCDGNHKIALSNGDNAGNSPSCVLESALGLPCGQVSSKSKRQ